METAAVQTADGNGALKRGTAMKQAGAVSVDTAAARSPYLADLYGVVDEIERFLPEVVQRLRERIADLERFLATNENPYIQNGAVAATHEVVAAIHRVIQRVVGAKPTGTSDS